MISILKKIIIGLAWLLIGCAIIALLAFLGYLVYMFYSTVTGGHR